MGKLMVEGGGVVLTAGEVAERIGVSRSRVRQLRLAGRFPGAVSRGNRWFFPESAIDEYMKNPDKRRRREEIVTGDGE